MLSRIVIRLLINSVALGAAAYLIPGIRVGDLSRTDTLVTIVVVALVFGLINALIRPVVVVLSCPLLIVTMGLFTIVINTVMLWLTGVIAHRVLGLPFSVATWVDAFLGSLVISVASFILSMLLGEEKRG